MELSNNILSIDFIYTSVVNYALQQNRIPIVRKLLIENKSEKDFNNLKIRLNSQPEFSTNWEHLLEILPQKQSIEIEVKDFNLSPVFLSEITERLSGELNLEVSAGEVNLYKKTYNVDVLAYDQWNGVSIIPEILAAFVTPNHPEISKIINRASTILEGWTGNPSFDAYQTLNPDRVKKQLGAIFEAIANLGIVYCSPPASFENQGQRIRMCDTIISQNIATCIDISILYASCIEAVGLNPLLIILNGHAFIGAWLINDTFADSVNYDISLLKKHSASGINEILLVEATCMNAGSRQSFDEAINEADYKLVKEEDFVLFIDVKRSRLSGIKPLPQRVRTVGGWEIKEEKESSTRESQVPVNIIEERTAQDGRMHQFSKQKSWERKLLDLSLRNNLLNLRITQSTIQLLSIKLNTFEDALANGDEFQILQKPDEWKNNITKSGVYQAINMSDPIVELLKHELSHKRLRTYLTENELRTSLNKLYRTSRLSLEENGANTLYLALGFLKWYETAQSELPRYAPILLLPVEIIRKSARVGYVIRSREEDTIMNITLLEMLKQDFKINITGLDELPRDDSGVDVTKIFNTIRRAIMSQPRWDLEEHAFLGIFSFNKFIMWNDINKNAEKLKENKIVASLISGKLEWEEEIISEVDLDDKYHPSEITLPINADSTQLEAICAAAENKSFILHGPPGTGKSQTITNIIANSLYKGKRVLFVAEKMAALSVVQKRLGDIGIAPFCLELHSNKSKKSTTLEQLQKTTEIIRKSSPLEFKSEAERLHKQRLELNEYVKALHKKHPFGFSLFDSFNGYAGLKTVPDNISFDKEFIEGLTKEKFTLLCDLVEELQNAGSLCGHPHNHLLKEINTTVYSQEIKAEASSQISNYLELSDEILTLKKEINEVLSLDQKFFNKEQTLELKQLAELLLSLPDTPKSLITLEQPERSLHKIIELSEHGKKCDGIREKLLKSFTKDILEFNADAKLAEWNILNQKWFVPKFFGQNKIFKSIRGIYKEGKLAKLDVASYLEEVINYQSEQKLLDENKTRLNNQLDFLWNDGNPDWDNIIKICNISLQIHKLLVLLTKDITKTNNIKVKISFLISDGCSTFHEIRGKAFLSYIEAINSIKSLENKLNKLLKIDFSVEEDHNSDWNQLWKQKAENWNKKLDYLKDWTTWNRIKEKTIEAKLLQVVSEYSEGKLKNEEVLRSFKKSLFRHFAEFIIKNDPSLSVFNGKIFDGKIDKFKQESRYFEDLTKAELFAKLASNLPLFTKEAVNNSEVGILQRAIRNGGRGMSLRRLFDSVPNLLPRLCPCMLMSPISVAQYFDVDKSKFDLVIFDEASQMPTCEAVGAIARGENVVVVGDPKQMPPTSFFSTNNYDEENADKEDLESILDDCIALSIPSKHLLWHYRSKHESLIAFSNSNFYDNKLLTFPSPDDITTKVSNIYVPGHYDRGKTRQNRFEAKAIVDEILSRLKDPILSKRSIGVVTFSAVQQNLIEDMLNEEFKSDPELEKTAMELYEPIFIKNLENVQGDERDVILFSVGYGPDKDGKIYMNFGPLVRKGGWRRLNVAISRARYEMKVFSTLRSDQIDIARSTSEEIVGFKDFLAYTEKGKRTLPQKNVIQKSKPRYFENMVADEIRKHGYSVETDIGCSGFRIDIGVVNPEKETEYILGILADGKNYTKAKTAKDREIIQTSVLNMLGWNIYKLWSPDWWDNPQKIIREILMSIKEAQNKNAAQNPEDLNRKSEEKISINTDTFNNVKLQSITQQVIEPDKNYITYKQCKLDKNSLFTSEEFFDIRLQPKILNQIQKIIDIEAPISHELLSRKILNAWGITRLGVRLNEYLLYLYEQLKLVKTTQGDSYFYWRENQNPKEYTTFRVPADNDFKREVEDIAKEEIINGVKEILTAQISLPQEDLIKEAARLFGFSRLGENVLHSVKNAINYALEKNLILNEDGRIKLNDR